MEIVEKIIKSPFEPKRTNIGWFDTSENELKFFINGKWTPSDDKVDVAYKAIGDEDGVNIKSDYAKKSEVDLKIDSPNVPGVTGQVLQLDSNGKPEWVTPSAGTTPDSQMSEGSTNAVQNKVIKEYIDGELNQLGQELTLPLYADMLVQGGYDANGNWSDYANNICVDGFYPVQPGQLLKIWVNNPGTYEYKWRFNFFNANKVWIDHIPEYYGNTQPEIVVPSGAAYVRPCITLWDGGTALNITPNDVSGDVKITLNPNILEETHLNNVINSAIRKVGMLNGMKASGETIAIIDPINATIALPIMNFFVGEDRYITTRQTLNIKSENNPTSGWMLIFNESTNLFLTKPVFGTLEDNEILAGQFLLQYNWTPGTTPGVVSANLPFDFTIGGSDDSAEKINLKIEPMFDIINTGIDTSAYRYGQIFRISENSIISAKGISTCKCLVALGDDLLMLMWNKPGYKYLSNWTDGMIRVDNSNYKAKYAFVFFGNGASASFSKDDLARDCSLYISNRKEFDNVSLTEKFNALAIAHRGIHLNNVPENSKLSYTIAAKSRMDICEADVCVTADRKFVMMHDTVLSPSLVEYSDGTPLASSVAISSLTLSQIKADYRLKSATPAFIQEIPTLEEYLEVCRDCGIYAFPELKSGSGTAGFTTAEAKEVCDLCLGYLGKDNFCIQSIAHTLLDYIRSIYEDVELCYMYLDIRNTTNEYTGESRFTKHTHAMITEENLSAEMVQAYRVNGSKIYDGSLITPTTLSNSIKRFDAPGLIANVCGPNLCNRNGVKFDSSAGWDGITTNGTITNGKLTLASGEYLAILAPIVFWGGQILRIRFNGGIKVKSAYNDTVNVSSSPYNEYLRRDFVYKNFGGYYIEATASTTIDFVSFEFARL